MSTVNPDLRFDEIFARDLDEQIAKLERRLRERANLFKNLAEPPVVLDLDVIERRVDAIAAKVARLRASITIIAARLERILGE